MIKELKQPEPKSASWIIEAIRGLLETAIKEPVTEFTYTALVNNELRTFGYKSGTEAVIACPECEHDEFTISHIDGFLDIECSKCGTFVGGIDPK